MLAARASSSPDRDAIAWAAPILLVAAAGAFVFRGALGYFFSQDDFWWLAHARGLMPPHLAPWRLISFGVFFRAMSAMAGLDARAYHLASLVAHLIDAALLYALLRRARLGAPAAMVGAVFFAVHPALFTALYWVSAIGDVLALGFALAAMLAFGARGAWRWLALPLIALSLLSKESTLLVPLWLALFGPRATGTEPARGRWRSRLADPVAIAMIAVSILFGLYLARADVFGARGAEAHQAYAMRLDSSIALNLLSYLGWSADFLVFTVRRFTDAIDPSVFPWSIGLALAWLAGLSIAPLRARGWLAGGTLALAGLAPVLPLGNHTYHYYLYAALAGIAWCVAAAFDAAWAWRARSTPTHDERSHAARSARTPRTERTGSSRSSSAVAAWTVAILIAAGLTANGRALVRKIERHPFIDPALRADPTVDRALIARRMIDDLGHASLPPGAKLFFWFPRALAPRAPDDRDSGRETYWERNVRSAVEDGIGVRLAFPELGEARFVGEFEPSRDALYAVYRLDGHLTVVTAAALDSLIRVMPRPSAASP